MGFVTYTTKSNHSDMYNVFKILHIEWEKKKKKGNICGLRWAMANLLNIHN